VFIQLVYYVLLQYYVTHVDTITFCLNGDILGYGGATLQSKLDCDGHFVVARADLQRHFLLFAGHTTVRYKL